MILAGHTMGTPEYSLPEALDLFARIGLEGAEVVWQTDYRCGLDPASDLAVLRETARRARDARVPIVALTPYDNLFNSLDLSERQRAVESFGRALAAAPVLDARWVRLYGGRFLQDDGRWKERWACLVDSLRVLGGRAERAGVTICVETHFNTMTDTAARAAALVREVGHPHVRVLYDQANLGFTSAEEWPTALRLLQGLIAYVHVKDFAFRDERRAFAAGDVTHVEEAARIVRSCVVGDGIVPWPEILSALRAGGYEGVLSLEYERRWHPQDLPPAETGMAVSGTRVREWTDAGTAPCLREEGSS
jgi:L-ribulose-5-phosphate 3-epimerase